MFGNRVSFSLYMAHGGTSFGGWVGCRNPFIPNVTSYDFEAPINENGRANPSYAKYRERAAKHLNPGETIPEPPADIPAKAYGVVAMSRIAAVDALAKRELKMERPEFMERLGQGFGLVSYERMLAPEDGGLLNVDELHDFGYVFLDGKRIGVLDRRHRGIRPRIYRSKENRPRLLQIVVEAMGRINSSSGMEDRKGMSGRVRLDKKELKGWTAKMMPFDPDGEDILAAAKTSASPNAAGGDDAPALYCGTLDVADENPADTFLDMTAWTKGIAWVNGHNLGRFWSIGPQQTLYVPGCWLRKGGNEVVVLDFFGPRGKREVDFVGKAVLDVLQLDTDFNRVRREHEKFVGGEEIASGTFPSGDESQVVMFGKGVRGNYFTLQALTTYDAKNLATISEFAFLDRDGNPINSLDAQITGVDSEEEIREDGVAENAIDGQIEAYWLTSSRTLPHWIEFYVPAKTEVFGFRYTPRQNRNIGRIKDWKFFAR
jgi:beta-galactosidase